MVVPSLCFHLTNWDQESLIQISDYCVSLWQALFNPGVLKRAMRADAHLRSLCVKCTGTNDKAEKASFLGCPERTVDAPVFTAPEFQSRGSWEGTCVYSFSWRADLLGILLAEAFTGGVGFLSHLATSLTQNSREYLERLILLPALFFTILRLSCDDLKLQVLFRILQRFPDNLAGRYNFIVQKNPLCSHVRCAKSMHFGVRRPYSAGFWKSWRWKEWEWCGDRHLRGLWGPRPGRGELNLLTVLTRASVARTLPAKVW